ncbi:hypothetical protein M758_5G155500 [Ceratodon purpureus]|nr:hypothetical protein M758_5G155500 [Ceratodon purpureus]
MTTLPSLITRSPSSPVLRSIAGHELGSSSTEVKLLISFKRVPGRAWSSARAGRELGCGGAEHGKALVGLEYEHGVAARCFVRQFGAQTRRVQNWRCKAHLESAEVGVADEANGAAVDHSEREERLLSKELGGGPREIRLTSVRGPDFDGASISSQVWEWRHRWNIHYESAGMDNTDAPALLLLPGFGVGSFHYDQQLRDLGREYRVWAMDFLGQGKSWPSHDPAPAEEVMEEVLEGQANAKIRDWGLGKTPESWAQELVYSVDTWRDQVHAFIEKVIGGPVYIVGNSLGGYVGTYFAATNPELVKGIALLNATPFWAFTPNARRYPLLSKLVPWGGLLPVPVIAKAIIRVWWDLLRNPTTVQKMIKLVYADCSVVNDKLVGQMLEATDHPAAFAAFTSIVFAPRAHTDFGQNLISLKETRTPMCLIYGKEDPWVVPFWGQRAKQRNPDAVYYELSPAGHCPHHEAPEVPISSPVPSLSFSFDLQ